MLNSAKIINLTLNQYRQVIKDNWLVLKPQILIVPNYIQYILCDTYLSSYPIKHVGLFVGIAIGSTAVVLLFIVAVVVYQVCHRVWPKKQKLAKTSHVNDVSMYRVG